MRRRTQALMSKTRSLAARLLGRGGFEWIGDYESFEAAAAECDGYDDQAVLDAVVAATRAVESGDAVYERDSAVLDHVEYSWPLLAELLWVGTTNDQSLSVLDFGGSLGSSFRQNRRYLGSFDCSWSVVEQPGFVSVGRSEFQTDVLRFYDSVEECLTENEPNLILLSSVIQYLESPFPLLRRFSELGVSSIVIARTPILTSDRRTDRITVQKVPKSLVVSSYPCRFFAAESILDSLAPRFIPFERYRDSFDAVLDFGAFESIIFRPSNGEGTT